MAERWHTDIVVSGEGMGLTLKRGKDGCYDLAVSPDTKGPGARKALARFKSAVAQEPPACTVGEAKRKVARAVRRARARWNRWHRQEY